MFSIFDFSDLTKGSIEKKQSSLAVSVFVGAVGVLALSLLKVFDQDAEEDAEDQEPGSEE